MKGYKAFKKGLICRGFQYKEGKTFEHTGDLRVCNSGFHFCENPLDVLNYYPLIDDNGELSDFAEVEALGDIKTEDNKSVTNKIKIGAKLDLPGFVKASFDFLWDKCKADPKTEVGGYGAKLASSGNDAQIASSGYDAQIASSGYDAQIASSGDGAKLASSGDGAKLASSGNYAKLALKGENSVGAAIGIESRIRAKLGCWITLAEWTYDENINRYIPKCVKSAQIDGDALKADAWYQLKNGEFEEIDIDD
ncbi:hypothetical protein SD70_27730 [Gordoniibacillus kamchatkensis]|uniref:DUF7666 domain-containing protein n=1 Tax=Gordoniibacillus kamchatkensis TaxID=1590651 RepID=A0ABR5AAY6_9BACL|nr:hypothetical protein [Paenibacillus sp. VKM B-2647]KIL38220.1 hypothetical protein SD70_27730 [Paenibacillus sp. VKM B-2647]